MQKRKGNDLRMKVSWHCDLNKKLLCQFDWWHRCGEWSYEVGDVLRNEETGWFSSLYKLYSLKTDMLTPFVKSSEHVVKLISSLLVVRHIKKALELMRKRHSNNNFLDHSGSPPHKSSCLGHPPHLVSVPLGKFFLPLLFLFVVNSDWSLTLCSSRKIWPIYGRYLLSLTFILILQDVLHTYICL